MGCSQESGVSLPVPTSMPAHFPTKEQFIFIWLSGKLGCLPVLTQPDHTARGRRPSRSL